MKKLLFISFLLFTTVVNSQTNLSLIVYSTDLGVGTQPGWTWWYNDSICPSGMGRQLSSGALTNQTATIMLPIVVSAGSYNAYVKINARDTGLIAGLGAGGALSLANCDDTDTDVYWTKLPLLTFPSATNVITFYWHTTDNETMNFKASSFLALFLTSDSNFIITGDDYKQHWNMPTVVDTSPAIPGNLLHNGSFEVGLEGWSFTPNTKVFYSPYDVLTNAVDSPQGVRSLAIPSLPPSLPSSPPQNSENLGVLWIASQAMMVRPNKPHTLSWYAKSIPAGGKVQGRINPALEVPNGFGLAAQTNYQSVLFTLTTNWTRYEMTNMILLDYPSPAQYYVQLEYTPTGAPTTAIVYLDGVKFEEGTVATAYTAAKLHEIGVEQTQTGGTYFVEDNNTQLKILVNASLTASRTLTYQISNRALTNLITYTNTATFSAGLSTIFVDGNALPLGPFRIAAWLDNGSEAEAYFSRIHRPVDLKRGESVIGGSHCETWWGNSQLANKRGVRFSRVFSPAGRFRWEFVEPTDNNFVFGDAMAEYVLQETECFLNLYQKRAVWANRVYIPHATPVGTGFIVGETVTQEPANSGLVTWVGTPADSATGYAVQVISGNIFSVGAPIIGDVSGTSANVSSVRYNTPGIPEYTNYVANFIGHYTNKFFAYEIMNEPNLDSTVSGSSSSPNYSFYAKIVHESVKAAKAVFPDVKLVAISGVNQTNEWGAIWNLFTPYVKTNLHATSCHLYNANSFRNEQFVELSKANGGPEVWQTEAGVENFSQYYGARSAWRNFGDPLLAFRDSEDFMRTWNEALDLAPFNMIEAIGGGISKYYYYFNGFFHHYGDPLSYSVTQTSQDLMEVQKPMDSANSFVRWALDGGKGITPRPTTPPGTKVYQIQAPWNVPWIAVKDINYLDAGYLPVRTNRIMNWGLTNGSQVEIYTVFGNRLTPLLSTTVEYDTIPVLVKGINGTTIAQMSNAVVAATYTTVADTVPPTISICDYPKGPVDALHNHRVRIRWLAWDNYFTTRTYFSAVDTRYKVDSEPFSLWDQISFVEYPMFDTVRRRVTPRLSSGTHTFTVEARDSAGLTATNSVTVTIL